MKNRKKLFSFLFTVLLMICFTISSLAGDGLTITPSADLVSRYNWRGIAINDAPNIQPSISFGIKDIEFGFWGSSTLGNNNSTDDYCSFSQETDLWFSYSHTFRSGLKICFNFSDYYFPNAGAKFGNINNYDADDGPGAHTIEGGLSFSGPDNFPLSIAAYKNLYNDNGYNSYFQIDYSTSINSIGINYFIGATTGSTNNPAYYGADNFSVICVGLTASKSIKITEKYSLPVFINYIINPRTEKANLIFGISL